MRLTRKGFEIVSNRDPNGEVFYYSQSPSQHQLLPLGPSSTQTGFVTKRYKDGGGCVLWFKRSRAGPVGGTAAVIKRVKKRGQIGLRLRLVGGCELGTNEGALRTYKVKMKVRKAESVVLRGGRFRGARIQTEAEGEVEDRVGKGHFATQGKVRKNPRSSSERLTRRDGTP